MSPLILIAFEAAAIYGLFDRYDGRKLYASFERLLDWELLAAPCFQPDAKYHLFGGSINWEEEATDNLNKSLDEQDPWKIRVL